MVNKIDIFFSKLPKLERRHNNTLILNIMTTKPVKKPVAQKGITWTCGCPKDNVYICCEQTPPADIKHSVAVQDIKISSPYWVFLTSTVFYVKVNAPADTLTFIQGSGKPNWILYYPDKECGDLSAWKKSPTY